MKIKLGPWEFIKAIVVLAVGGPIIFGGVALATYFIVPLPNFVPEPTAGATAQTSHVYAADDTTLIATFHAEHNREPISIELMPKHLQDAAVAVEDSRFFSHSGVDMKAIFRVLLADLRNRSVVQGGSTITQQYVRNAYIEDPLQRTLFRKVREAIYASLVERDLSKEQILENYLNTVYFGKGAYGVQAAAKTFFNKPASELSLSESALLVGLIRAPITYSPYDNPERAEQRRLYVLERMEVLRLIDVAQANEVQGHKPVLHNPGEQVFKHPWFVDAVRRFLIATYGEQKVFSGGLRVTTTLEPSIQEAAEKAVASVVNKPDYPYAALASVDPHTGYIRALVGGRDYEKEKFNIALQGRRQPGSAFKPFVLVTALEQGIKPSARFRGPNKICLRGWKPNCPENFGTQSFGSITLEKATLNSVNTVYAQLVLRVGPDKVVDMAGRMGVPGPEWMPRRSGCKPKPEDPCRTRIDPVPALTLGTEEVTPLEMASAYATLAARGAYRAPKIVSKVVDPNGKPVPTADGPPVPDGPSEPVQVMEEAVADTANKILEKVITSGTGRRADIGRPAAGKTGTAQDFQNAWFAGHTPDLATAVWMGYRDVNRKMTNVRGVGEVVGGSLPALIWASFMKAALSDIPPAEFPKPGEITSPGGGSGFRLPYRPRPTPSPSPTPEATAEPAPETASPEPSPEDDDGLPGGGKKPRPSPTPSPLPTEGPL